MNLNKMWINFLDIPFQGSIDTLAKSEFPNFPNDSAIALSEHKIVFGGDAVAPVGLAKSKNSVAIGLINCPFVLECCIPATAKKNMVIDHQYSLVAGIAIMSHDHPSSGTN
jgi:hypothetical protein